MVNGLGVVGWGVGGIEAEAAMLGQPSSMLIPPVVGYRLTGRLPEGATATDLVLTITEALRKKGVVGTFVEFYGPGLAHLTIADRVTLGNMCPEYGATVAIFPIDDMTLDYLRFTGRDAVAGGAGRGLRARRRACSAPTRRRTPIYTDTLELDLATVVPSLAGPRRPQDRVAAQRTRRRRSPSALPDLQKGVKKVAAGGRRRGGRRPRPQLEHGSVVIAAITSCTNTSNPSVMIGAGLVAKKAVERGLTQQAVGEDQPGAGLEGRHRVPRPRPACSRISTQLGFNLVGYGCTTCIGNSGPLPDEIGAEVREHGLVVALGAVSGNRNFEGRIQQDVRANYLASPPLVVAYALAGSMNVDSTTEPLGTGTDGKPVYLKDIWPTEREDAADDAGVGDGRDVPRAVRERLRGRRALAGAAGADRRPLRVGGRLDLHPQAAVPREPDARARSRWSDITGARVLALLGDSITTDHISPAGSIKADSPAGQVPHRAAASSRRTSTPTARAAATTK